MSYEKGHSQNIQVDEFVEKYIYPTGVSAHILSAFKKVDRAIYVPAEQKFNAYEDRPLYLADGSTISQPRMVAEMLRYSKFVGLVPKVLEIGTASGYNAALMSHLSSKVDTVEVNAELAKQAEENLHTDGRHNVAVHIGDGALGLPINAPYDRIIVTAALRYPTQPLLDQLKSGGRMVAPIGEHPTDCRLTVINKTQDGKIITRRYVRCAFVPLISEVDGAWTEGDLLMEGPQI